ncbi:valine--tRNA ligase, partial [Candidatus Uhrbacteria bacterium RIFCSPHIGHO2_02_FULL_47_29]
KGGYFLPKRRPNTKTKKPFIISLPPPNATGTLHLGHAMMLAIEDLMIRYHRLKGEEVLWVPGTDHAAIATQNVVEKKIWQEEKKTRHDLGRETLLRRIEEFVEQSRGTIRSQFRRMGASLDWSHERYTLDEGLSRCVRMIFKMMYDDGLIYRGNRVVNWCTRCQTTLADDEVEHRETTATLYTFRYSKDFPILIASTRPETKLGDTAVAVHPDDERYRQFVGQTLTVSFAGKELTIRIVADPVVDREFGTGAVGVTPAHSQADAEIAERHKLPAVKVVDEAGAMTDEAGPDFAELPVSDVRTKVVAWLRKHKLIEKEETVPQNLTVCYRCETPVEPLVSKQWFVAVNKLFELRQDTLGNVRTEKGAIATLKVLMQNAVESGQITIIPDRFQKTYLQWIYNLRDWCISRQIWFGHRIPVWYRPKADQPGAGLEIYVGIEPPKVDGWEQDPDTLDTWFSSGLWTFSTLLKQDGTAATLENWQAESPDLKRYHPTSVLETGYDILFFWVARMVLMTTYALGEVPFRTVYLHGLVRDKDGRKMSKSLGNVIDPVDMIDKYGADAVRLSLIIGTTPGNDVRLYEEKIAGYRNFVNKLWNISRYILTTTTATDAPPKAKTLADRWILAEFEQLKHVVAKHIDAYRFSPAGEALYEFTWSKLADWYVETTKVEGGKDAILRHILRELLVLWHPFTPFVTEHIWQLLGESKPLISTNWPKIREVESVYEFSRIQETASAMRNLKQKHGNNLEMLYIVPGSWHETLATQRTLIETLGRSKINFAEQVPADVPKRVLDGATVFAMAATVDKKKLQTERDELERYITTLHQRIQSDNFSSRAPAAVIAKEKERLQQAKKKLKHL